MENEELTILLIEDNPGDALLIKTALADVPNVKFVLEWKDRLSEGLKRLSAGGIDMVLLDLHLPDSRSFDTFIKVYAQAPEVPIIVLSGLDDESVAVRAVREGAQDYLIKGEVNHTNIVRSILYAVERQRAQNDRLRRIREEGKTAGHLLGFIGAKGGVGASTVALNVATLLARGDNTVILTEFRSDYGTLSLLTGEGPREDISSLIGIPADQITEAELRKRLVQAPYGPRILFGPQSPSAERWMEPAQAKTILSTLASMADYVILDLPPRASAVNQIAVQQCHRVTVLVEPEPVSVAAAKRLMAELRAVVTGPAVQGAVVVNRTGQVLPMNTTEIESQLGCEIFGVIPPAPNVFAAAQRSGTPIVVAQPRPAAALSLAELTRRLLQSPAAVK